MRFCLLFIALAIATPAWGDSVVLRKIIPGDQLGFLLKCLGHKHLWGKKGAVVKAVTLNETRLVRREGNLIFPKSNLKLPLPKGVDRDEALAQIATCREERDAALEADTSMESDAPAEVEAMSVPAAKLSAKRKAKRKVAQEASPTPTEVNDEMAPLGEPEPTPEVTPTPTPVRTAEPTAPPRAAPTLAPTAAFTLAPSPSPTATATPVETRRPEPKPRKGLRGYAGLDFSSRSTLYTVPGATDRASRGFLSAIVGGQYPLTEKIDAFGDLTLGAISLWNDKTESIRPLDVRLGILHRRPLSERTALVFRGYLRFLTTFGGNLSPGYRNLLGPAARVEWRRRWHTGEFALGLAAALYNSDRAVLTPSNNEFDFCGSYEPTAIVDGGRYEFFGCFERLNLGSFQNGSGSQSLWRFGALYHF